MAMLKRKTLRRARALRGHMTDAEVILWSRLRRGGILHGRFRRQHPIGPYIADFACLQTRLVLEVDGATHGTEEERAHDRRRDAYLRQLGWKILRFTNDDVYKHLNDVLDVIQRVADGEIPPQ